VPLDFNSVMGSLALGNLDDAADACAQALRENPRDATALKGLALVALRKQDFPRAIEFLQREIEIQPNAWSFATVSAVYTTLRRFEEAAVWAQQAVDLEPQNADVLSRLAAAREDLGQFDEAIRCYRAVIRLRPSSAAARGGLGVVFSKRGDGPEALACFEDAARLDPTLVEVRLNLARCLTERGELERALEHSEAAVRLRADSAVARDRELALLNLGNVLFVMDRFDDARSGFLRALAINPDSADAHVGFGGALQQLGESEAAAAEYRAALRLDPGHAGALVRLARSLGTKLPESDARAIEDVLSNTEVAVEQVWSLEFAMAHWHDASSRYEDAARFAHDANAHQAADRKRRRQDYDPREHSRLVSQLMAAFSPEFLASLRTCGSESERPVFVVGLPRSGTTLVEQILASHSQVVGGGELRFIEESWRALARTTSGSTPRDCVSRLTEPLARGLAEQYLQELDAIDAAAHRVVDKMPDNAVYLGWIRVLFPRAKVVHCTRDPRDVALSCWMTDFARVRWTNDFEHIAGRIHDHIRIMEHWRSALPGSVLELKYEDLVANLEDEARRLIAWCGLEWDPACLNFHQTRRAVATASASQVRRPIYQTSVRRWKNYERFLGELFAQL
jgi:tetratricopeptide (TPR) repeat protein